jgi:PucR family transcriptional regulator, purine catabolism regulatory protein
VRVSELLTLPLLGRARLVAGRAGVDREVQWAGVVDIPDPHEWLRPGHLLLSTGYAWPRDEEGQRLFVRSLDERGLAALALAVPQFFSEVPPAVVREADAVGLPVLEVPWEIPFARITEETQRALLAEQQRVIVRSEAIHRALTQAAVQASGLQEIANVLSELIERDVTFESVSGQLFAASYRPGERDAVRDRTVSQGVTPPEVMAELERSGILQRLRTQKDPVWVPAVPELGLTPRVACPIRVSGELVGLVWVLEGSAPVGELDVRAAEHAATVVALHIAHQQTLAQLESRLGYAFLDSLLDGRLEPTPQNLERSRLLGFEWERGYRVGIAVLNDVSLPLSKDDFLRREQLAERLRQRVRGLGGAPLLSVTLNEVSVLLEEGVDPAELGPGAADEGVGMAWGRVHHGVAGIQRSFREARSLLPHLVAGEALHYDAWLVPRVLLGDAEARAALLDEVFGPLRARRGGGRLVETVVAWARCGFQGKRAAADLGVHDNTVRYRLERVAEALQVDLADPDVRFRLRLASDILALADKNAS